MGMFNDIKKLASKIDPAMAEKAMSKLGLGDKKSQGSNGNLSNGSKTQSPAGSNSNLNVENYDSGHNGSGKKRALLIGINYFGTKAELKGCINDVKNVNNFIREKYNYQEVLILSDDQQDPQYKPTKQNMINALRWLVQDARQHDSLFLHYSGHGTIINRWYSKRH